MVIRDNNGVPILAISAKTQDHVARKHAAALDPANDEPLLTGEKAWVHNKRPVGAPAGVSDVTFFLIGGETLDEAAKSVVGAFEFHGNDHSDQNFAANESMPDGPGWVASSSKDLAKVLGEHYGCEVKDPNEVTA